MAPLYEEVCAELGVSGNATALAEMRERNAKQLAELEEKIKDAGGAVLLLSQCIGLARSYPFQWMD